MRNRKIFLSLLFIFLFCENVSSYAHSEITIEEGLNDIYNVRLDDAENKFRSYQVQYPDDIKGYFYESMIYFYKAGTTRDETYYGKYLELTNNVIEKCENALDKNDSDVDALFYKGAAHSYRSLIMLMLNKSLLKAADNGNDGYRILKKITQKYPDYYDAYMGLGLFKIAISFIPEKFQWMLSLIGIDGGLKDGLEMLRTASEKAKFNKTDAKVFLAVFLIREKEELNTEPLNILKNLVNDFPESPAIRMLYGGFLVQICRVDDGVKQFEIALNLNKFSLQKELNKGIYSFLGTAYFRKNDFNKAALNLEESFKYMLDEDRYNLTMNLLGISYEMIGRRDLAIEKYKAARDKYIEERDGEAEKLYFRYSLERMKTSLNELDSLMIIAINEKETGDYDKSLNTFNEIAENKWLEKYTNDDLRIKYYYELGILYTFRKENDKAIECFNKSIKINPPGELWLIPHSYFELGKIYYRAGNKEMGREMFDKVFEYKDYDFRNFLEMRVRNFLDK